MFVKVLLQRVSRASVSVGGDVVARIGRGLLAFVGVERDDDERVVDYYADKTAELRVFPDETQNMNRSVEEIDGAVLVVSQFTLSAATRRGRRPSFSRAAPPNRAEPLYRRFCDRLEERGLELATGRFQAMMDVELINEGPVTILLDPPGDEGR